MMDNSSGEFGGLVVREMQLVIELPELPRALRVERIEFPQQRPAGGELPRGDPLRRQRHGLALEQHPDPPQFVELLHGEHRHGDLAGRAHLSARSEPSRRMASRTGIMLVPSASETVRSVSVAPGLKRPSMIEFLSSR